MANLKDKIIAVDSLTRNLIQVRYTDKNRSIKVKNYEVLSNNVLRETDGDINHGLRSLLTRKSSKYKFD